MTTTGSTQPLWTRDFIFLLTLGTLTSTSFFMVNPIISKYAISLGTTLAVAGIVAGLFSITALVARPLGAVLADRLNKKYVLAGATAMMGIASLGYALSTNVVLLVFFRVLHGVSFAVSGTATTTLIASIIPRNRLGEGIGYYGMGSIIATALGPNIGLLMTSHLGYVTDFMISGLVVVAAALVMTRIRYAWTPASPTEGRRKITIHDLISLQVLPLALLGGLFSFSNGIVSSFLVLIGDQRGIANIGLYFTVLALCLLVVRPFTGKLTDRKGFSFILYPSLLLIMVESALLAHAAVLWVVLLAAVAKAFAQGAAQPAIQATCLRKLDPSRSGVAAATFFIGADIGQGVGPMVGGAISQAFGYPVMFYVCILVFASGLAGFTLYQAWKKRREKRLSLPAADIAR